MTALLHNNLGIHSRMHVADVVEGAFGGEDATGGAGLQHSDIRRRAGWFGGEANVVAVPVRSAAEVPPGRIAWCERGEGRTELIADGENIDRLVSVVIAAAGLRRAIGTAR